MTSHPYYPISLEIHNYVPNSRSTAELLVVAAGLMTSLVVACLVVSKLSKATTSLKRFTWFAICGIMHIGFEGYWLWNKSTVAAQNDILAQLWKEYAHGDSRYLVADELLVTLELMTCFIWGPLCLLSAYYIWKGSKKQYFYQLIASLCHLFSCSLYYIMDLPEATHCVPEAVYFWIYFISFNAPWIIVPLTLVCQSYQHIIKPLLLESNYNKSK